jgi:RimJ/RimL family protein N-acetyltransferase
MVEALKDQCRSLCSSNSALLYHFFVAYDKTTWSTPPKIIIERSKQYKYCARCPIPPTAPKFPSPLILNMNSPQAHLRLQKARETRLQLARQRRFDESIFVPLETPHLWLCAVDKTKSCHLSSALVDNASIAALKDDKLKDENSITWFIYHKDNPVKQIGSIWLFDFSTTDVKIATAMIGYTLAETARGKGYMSESLGAVIGFAFEKLGLHKLEARVRSTNERSKAVIQRAFFKNVGVVRKGKWGLGEARGIEIVELEVWILKKEDWAEHLEGLIGHASL